VFSLATYLSRLGGILRKKTKMKGVLQWMAGDLVAQIGWWVSAEVVGVTDSTVVAQRP
jgi:hypothetical protein